MAREIVTKKIGGVEYIATQFPPRKSLKVLTRLTRVIGQPLMKLMNSVDGEKGILDQDVSKLDIGGAISALGNALGDDDLYEIAVEVCECVTADGVQLIGDKLDVHFTGKLDDMFKVVAFAVEVNYQNFLGDLVAKAGNLAPATNDPSTST